MLLQHIGYPYLEQSNGFLIENKDVALIKQVAQRVHFYLSNALVISLCICRKNINSFYSSPHKNQKKTKQTNKNTIFKNVEVLKVDVAHDYVLNNIFPSFSSMLLEVKGISCEIK